MEETHSSIRGREHRAVVAISSLFLCVFTAYNSIQNLQSSINQEDGLGVQSLTINQEDGLGVQSLTINQEDGLGVQSLTINQEDGLGVQSLTINQEDGLGVQSLTINQEDGLGVQSLTINQEDGLGVQSLTCIYSFLMASALLAPIAIRLLTAKGVIILSCSVHLLYAATNFYPRKWTILPASVLLGSISGMFWTAQGTYIATCAFSYSSRLSIDSSYALGRFYSIFSTVFVASSIIGNLLSSILLGLRRDSTEQDRIANTSFISNTSFTLHNISAPDVFECQSNFCPFLSMAGSSSLLPNRTFLYYLLAAFTGSILLALGIAVFILPPLPKLTGEEYSRQNLCFSALSSIKLLKDRKLQLTCPLLVAFGWAQSFKWTDVTRAYISCPYGIYLVGFMMATHGGSLAIVTFLVSKVAKHVGRAKVLFVFLIGYILLFVSYFLLPEGSVAPVMFVMIAVHGSLEGPIWALTQATVGLMHECNKDAAFANLGFWRSLSNTIYFATGNYVCVRYKLIVLLILFFVTLPCFVTAEILYAKEQEQKDQDVAGGNTELREQQNTG